MKRFALFIIPIISLFSFFTCDPGGGGILIEGELIENSPDIDSFNVVILEGLTPVMDASVTVSVNGGPWVEIPCVFGVYMKTGEPDFDTGDFV